MQADAKPVAAPKLWTVLALCHRAVAECAARSIVASGLCPSDFAALEALLHKGPLTVNAIRGKVLLTSGSTSTAIDRLEARGLVVRKADAEDRRARLVELTPKGRALIQTVYALHARALEEAMAGLTPQEKSELHGLLKKLGISAAERLKAGFGRAADKRRRGGEKR